MDETNEVLASFSLQREGVTLMVAGPFQEQDLGVKCYHSKVGAVELLLNHSIEGPDEYIVVDMTAGADTFASGLFTRFDLTFMVVEPTKKSLDVYRQYMAYSAGYDVNVRVIANKVEGDDDIAFVRDQVGDAFLGCVERSPFVRAMEKGRTLPFAALESSTVATLATMKRTVDSCAQDWEKFYRQAVEFHCRNAQSWMNSSLGEDVTAQIDPDFSLQAAFDARSEQYRFV